MLQRSSAATGLVVYRDDAVPALTNLLLFGDNPSGEVFFVHADQLPTGGQDAIRRVRPSGLGFAVPDADAFLHRSRRSIAIDLKRDESAPLVLRLCERADALIEGFRPGVTEKLGIGPEPCLTRNLNRTGFVGGLFP